MSAISEALTTRRGKKPALPAMQPIVGWMQRNGVFFALIFLTLYFSLATERFLAFGNFEVILVQAAVVGIIAVPGAMLVISGYVDLSVGSVAVLTSIVFGAVYGSQENLFLALVFALGVATAWGVGNGLLVAFLGLSPIIVTLGGLAAGRGVAQVISEGGTVFGFGRSFAFLGNGEILGIRMPVWIALAVVLLGAFVWYQMPYGRHMMAIGADRAAAHSLGVGVRQIPFILYVVSGFAAGAAGVIITARLDAASLSIGTGLELEVLTAILLGGVAFTGGRGALAGVVWGVLFIAVLTNGLTHAGVSPGWTRVALGVALVMAAALDVVYQRLERLPVRDADVEREQAEVSERPGGEDADPSNGGRRG